MGRAQAKIDIDRPADEVWAVVRDFGNIGWMPGIDGVTVDGSTRTISMMGMEITEELRSTDEAARSLTYGIVGGALGVEHHQGVVTVTPSGEACTVTWDVDVEPDNLTDIMLQTYQGALQALKEKTGS